MQIISYVELFFGLKDGPVSLTAVVYEVFEGLHTYLREKDF